MCAGAALIGVALYCAPHHSATMQALVGGGPGIARPGAVSLSPRGLFLDETPEFSGQALDTLRQPLEAGHVVIARSARVVRFPATRHDAWPISEEAPRSRSKSGRMRETATKGRGNRG